MRRIDFSQDNISVQWQYLKRNLRTLGILGNFDDFEPRFRFFAFRAQNDKNNLAQNDKNNLAQNDNFQIP